MPIPARWSASDLVAAARCEFAFMRTLAGAPPSSDADSMRERTAELGGAHERRVLEGLRAEHGPGLVEVPRAGVSRDEALGVTLQAVDEGAPVIYQAAVLTEEFTGFADFLVRRADGRYRVVDTKLARTARVAALLQVAAYADHLRVLGVEVDDDVDLVLGDGVTVTHALAEVEPVYRVRRARIEHLRAHATGGDAAEWGDPRYTACGRCPTCQEQVEATRDVLLVANLSVTQRRVLRAAGIATIDDLAASAGPVAGIGDRALENLRAQARLQLAAPADPHAAPPVEVVEAGALAAIPTPDDGDLFFDFEGDPLYTEGGQDRWGLDYLFGWVDVQGRFASLWAHDFDEERVALRRFLDFVAQRRERYPDLHIYHYASYEKSHLVSLAGRHGEGEDEVRELLAAGVLVDLHPVVRRALRVGSRSYSIKRLEPLYMGEQYRDEEGVTTALGSVDLYVEACRRRSEGDDAGWADALARIAEYNAYDCTSTLRLRDWLRGVAARHGVRPRSVSAAAADDGGAAEDGGAADGGGGQSTEGRAARRALARRLRAHAGDPFDPGRSADEQAIGLVAAAVEYHDREEDVYWAGLWTQREAPVDELARTRDAFVVDDVEVVGDWTLKQCWSRQVRLTGSWTPGSDPDGVRDAWLLYPAGAPVTGVAPSPTHGPIVAGVVVGVEDARTILVRERLPKGQEPHGVPPVAVLPGLGVRTTTLKDAISAWAAPIAEHVEAGTFAQAEGGPLLDVLRRVPPRPRSGVLARGRVGPDGETDHVGAIVASLLDLDGSYLAVQGPPGTGKTYTAGHVVARLVRDHGWRVGVVAQSHAVIDNALRAVAAAGLPRERIGKWVSGAAPRDADTLPWTVVTKARSRSREAFVAGTGGGGYVFGATAWSVGGDWDLLVVDEAGQYSLAMTAAAQGEARRLVFLGDPQQLPQVTLGVHPEPVDRSALGWVAADAPTLPAHLGYFIEATRRLSPDLTAPVSRLQYADRLRPHPVTRRRHLDGSAPGLHPVPVPHRGNVQSSTQEAAAVVAVVADLLGDVWTTEHGHERGLTETDFIVVTPYNAQRVAVARALASAGLTRVPVGTVDKFQGQEAVVAIVTLAASDATEVPRGLEFLIDRHRLNVAISRAQWSAYLIHSPYLVDHLPPTPPGLARLSAFARLVAPR